MKKTYLKLLQMIVDRLDYRELKLSKSGFEIKQMILRLEKKKGPISKREIEVIENLYEEYKKRR